MPIKEFLVALAWVCSIITTIGAAVILTFKPVREKVHGRRSVDEGVKCLLRSNMLNTYYHHRENKKIRQFEYENFILEYKAYKCMGGNSFIDHIMEEVDEWEVVS